MRVGMKNRKSPNRGLMLLSSDQKFTLLIRVSKVISKLKPQCSSLTKKSI